MAKKPSFEYWILFLFFLEFNLMNFTLSMEVPSRWQCNRSEFACIGDLCIPSMSESAKQNGEIN
jgi:hypothetical protein